MCSISSTLEKQANAVLSTPAAALLDKLLDGEIGVYSQRVNKRRRKRGHQKRAQAARQEYDRLNVHDDELDMSEAALSIAIALLGVSALTRKRWLVALESIFAGFGVVLGVAGFLDWNLHPDALAKRPT